MRTTMLSKLLYGAGLIAIMTAIIQWYVKFPDISQLVFGLHIAITLIMCAYLHSWIVDTSTKIEELNEALDKSITYTRNVEELIKR